MQEIKDNFSEPLSSCTWFHTPSFGHAWDSGTGKGPSYREKQIS